MSLVGAAGEGGGGGELGRKLRLHSTTLGSGVMNILSQLYYMYILHGVVSKRKFSVF